MSDSDIGRREFVLVATAFLGTVMGTVVGLPAIGYLLHPALPGNSQGSEAKIEVGELANYEEGVPTPFSFVRTKINGWEKTANSYTVFITRKGDSVTVLSNICTHLSCRVKWESDRSLFSCPCHDAAFNPDGTVNSGPPPKPLPNYNDSITIEDGKIFFVFKEG